MVKIEGEGSLNEVVSGERTGDDVKERLRNDLRLNELKRPLNDYDISDRMGQFGWDYGWELPSDPQLINPLYHLIGYIMGENGFNYGKRNIFSVRLAVEEAIVNCIKHGNKSDYNKKVRFLFSIDNRIAQFIAQDEGEGFDPAKVPNPLDDANLEVERGRGIVLMRAYMDRIAYLDGGRTVVLTKSSK